MKYLKQILKLKILIFARLIEILNFQKKNLNKYHKKMTIQDLQQRIENLDKTKTQDWTSTTYSGWVDKIRTDGGLQTNSKIAHPKGENIGTIQNLRYAHDGDLKSTGFLGQNIAQIHAGQQFWICILGPINQNFGNSDYQNWNNAKNNVKALWLTNPANNVLSTHTNQQHLTADWTQCQTCVYGDDNTQTIQIGQFSNARMRDLNAVVLYASDQLKLQSRGWGDNAMLRNFVFQKIPNSVIFEGGSSGPLSGGTYKFLNASPYGGNVSANLPPAPERQTKHHIVSISGSLTSDSAKLISKAKFDVLIDFIDICIGQAGQVTQSSREYEQQNTSWGIKDIRSGVEITIYSAGDSFVLNNSQRDGLYSTFSSQIMPPTVDPVVLTALADQAQSHFDDVTNQGNLLSTHVATAAQIVGAKDLTTIVGIQTTKSQLETLKAAVQTNIDARDTTVAEISLADWNSTTPPSGSGISNWSEYLNEPLTGYSTTTLALFQSPWASLFAGPLDDALLIVINTAIQDCDDAELVVARRPQPMVFVMDGGDEVSSAQTVETYDHDLVDDEYVKEGSKFHAVFVPETAVPLSTIFTPLVKASSFDLDNIDVDTQTSIRSACVKTLATSGADDEYYPLEVALEEVNDILAYCIDSTLKESSSDQASFFNLMSSMCMAAIYGGTDRALNWGEETLDECRTFGDATLCAALELSVPLDWSGDTEFSGAFNAIVRNKNDIMKGYAAGSADPKQVYENIFSNALVLDAAKSAMVGTGNLQNQLGAPPQAEYETTPIDEATFKYKNI